MSNAVPLSAKSPYELRVNLGADVGEADVRTALATGDMGFLHSFTTGSAVDGPGIRVVAWTAGCQWRCLYCHNPDTWTMRNGIPVTSVHRTIFDYAGLSSVGRLEAAMREAEYRRLWDRLSLPALLARHPGHRGNANLRLCLERLSRTVGFTRSDLEELFLPLLDRFDLPRPHLNARLHVGGEWIEVDCLWRDLGLAVELDSRSAHETRSAFEADRDRDRRLQAEGWRVVRITWRQLHDEPERIASDLGKLMKYKRT